MNKILSYITILAFCISMSGCDLGNDPEPGGTKVQAMAGEWWIQVYSEGVDLGVGYSLLTTANTAANTDTDLQLDDHDYLADAANYPAIKIVAKVDISELTFNNTPNITNMHAGESAVNIIEGKVLKSAITTSSKTVTDSIYVKFEFVDIPGEIYEYAGYRRTGFQEDEH